MFGLLRSMLPKTNVYIVSFFLFRKSSIALLISCLVGLNVVIFVITIMLFKALVVSTSFVNSDIVWFFLRNSISPSSSHSPLVMDVLFLVRLSFIFVLQVSRILLGIFSGTSFFPCKRKYCAVAL